MQRGFTSKNVVYAVLTLWCLGHSTSIAAGPIDISDGPLFLDVRTVPNILFLIDNGDTMDFEVMTRDTANSGRFTGTQPDGSSPTGSGSVRHRDDNDNGEPDCAFARNGQTFNGYIYGTKFPGNTFPGGGGGNCNIADDQEWRFRNSDFNPLYFNPTKTYAPWPGLGPDGLPYGNMPITAAKDNPSKSNSATLDLTRHNSKGEFSDRDGDGQPDGFRYYTWTDGKVSGVRNGLFDDGEETEYLIKNANAATQQNFANWFSYHRRRAWVMKSAYGNLISQATDQRMGLVLFHGDGANTPIRPMLADPTTGDKRTLLTNLYNYSSQGNKTLRSNLDQVGQYLGCNSGNGLFNTGECPALPADNGGTCQQNFVLLTTDGFYDDSFSKLGNDDGDRNTKFDGGAYADTYSHTAADVAMYYYERDLQPGLTDDVPTIPGVDEARHQHMVTFAVAFGVSGTLQSNPPNPKDPFPWPDPESSVAAKIDDVRHAAYNGRGVFLSANNPDELTKAIQDALDGIAVRTSSAAAVALNSGSFNTDSRVYQARFNSGDWSGQLLSFPVQAGGTLSAAEWDAAVVLDGQHYDSGRTILTYKRLPEDLTAAGIPFRWESLSLAQRALLDLNTSGIYDGQSTARVNYLRGSRADEGAGNNYRTRLRVLGDLINSDPFFIGPPSFPDSLGSGYAAFRDAFSDRTPMLAVGSNDGMLHIFHGNTGQELLAYVPRAIFSGLSRLTSPTYRHRYYVDGSPTAGDVYINRNGTNVWRTVLVSGLRAGGQGYVALDVTDPATFNEASAADHVMWEFTDAQDADLGLTYSQPSLVRMANGRWAAVFGNGYNNTTADGHVSLDGRAKLFIVFLDGGQNGTWTLGTDYIKIDTETGSTAMPNGLSTPTPVDVNSDGTADYVVAGDLYGNMWKFDVRDPNPSNWKVAYAEAGKPVPLFTAKNTSGATQPITTRPDVGEHPAHLGGFIVYFGTGQYLGDSDVTTTSTQTFYGIWDNDAPVLNRGVLLRQTVVAEVGGNVRVTSNTSIDWNSLQGWYIDLPASGERQVSNSRLRNGRIIFTTLIPDARICGFGGTGWLMELDTRNGGRLDVAAFDLSGDKKFDDSDYVNVTIDGSSQRVPPSGTMSTEGILPAPTVLSAGSTEYKYSSGSTGGIFTVIENPGPRAYGRQAWRQLF